MLGTVLTGMSRMRRVSPSRASHSMERQSPCSLYGGLRGRAVKLFQYLLTFLLVVLFRDQIAFEETFEFQ
jgi:hypothetical protein